jgi:hypothetical protein
MTFGKEPRVYRELTAAEEDEVREAWELTLKPYVAVWCNPHATISELREAAVYLRAAEWASGSGGACRHAMRYAEANAWGNMPDQAAGVERLKKTAKDTTITRDGISLWIRWADAWESQKNVQL